MPSKAKQFLKGALKQAGAVLTQPLTKSIGNVITTGSFAGRPAPFSFPPISGVTGSVPTPIGPVGVGVNFGPSSVSPSGAGGVCPKGYHLNKRPLAATKRHGPMPARSLCVRNRHRNPANGRAIQRAISRVKAGEKVFRRVYSIVHHKAGGAVRAKTRRK